MKRQINKGRIVSAIKRDQANTKKGRVNLYLSLALYKEFREACEKEGIPASAAVERLMEGFLGR